MPDSFSVLEMRIDAVQHEDVLNQMDLWIHAQDRGRYVLVTNSHSILTRRTNARFRAAANDADLVIPDGMPVVVVGRWRGFPLRQRADGPGLMLKALDFSSAVGWNHYFYGGSPETLRRLLERLRMDWPRVRVAGSYSPPFHPVTKEEDDVIVELINNSRADVLWVGLGCPKQEIWMWQHHDKLNVPVILGVGLAFDLLAGVKKRAPTWMRDLGLEWLYRLAREPRRLWRRYIINVPLFVWLVIKEEIALRVKKSQ